MKNSFRIFLAIVCVVLGQTTSLFGNIHYIEEIPSGGILIDQPGTYYFKKNLNWSPAGDGAAISIVASDVVLDLRGYSLTSTTTPFKTTGISAAAGNNVTIANGKVKNMGLAGVQCTFCANVLIEEIEVNGLTVEDVANFVVPTGILASECYNVTVDRCCVKNIDVRTASCAGIQMTATELSKIIRCKVSRLLNRDGACSGIGHILCDNATVESCFLSHIKTTFIDNLNTQGHTAIGLIPTLSNNILITHCTVTDVQGCCDDAHGMSVFLCTNATVENSSVCGVIDGLGAAEQGAKATGIEVYGDYVVVRDCCVKDIFAINPEDKQSTGFSSGASHNVQFLRCVAKNVQVFDAEGRQEAALGYGTGFGWAPDPRPDLLAPTVNVLYQDCLATGCQVGFDSWFHIDSVWDNVVSIQNEIAVLNLGGDAQRTLSCSPCSECGCTFPACYPTPYVVTVNNVAENNVFWVRDADSIILKEWNM